MINEAIRFIYLQAKKFRRKHPLTIAFRLKAHSKILAKHLNEVKKLDMFLLHKRGRVLMIFFLHML